MLILPIEMDSKNDFLNVGKRLVLKKMCCLSETDGRVRNQVINHVLVFKIFSSLKYSFHNVIILLVALKSTSFDFDYEKIQWNNDARTPTINIIHNLNSIDYVLHVWKVGSAVVMHYFFTLEYDDIQQSFISDLR